MSNKNKKADTFLKYLYKMSIGGVVGDPINPQDAFKKSVEQATAHAKSPVRLKRLQFETAQMPGGETAENIVKQNLENLSEASLATPEEMVNNEFLNYMQNQGSGKHDNAYFATQHGYYPPTMVNGKLQQQFAGSRNNKTVYNQPTEKIVSEYVDQHELIHNMNNPREGYNNPYDLVGKVEGENAESVNLYKQINNINPYAKSVIKGNTLVDPDGYYSDPDEVLAGKRQVELRLENAPEGAFKTAWKYGDPVTEEHFKYMMQGANDSDMMKNAIFGKDRLGRQTEAETKAAQLRFQELMKLAQQEQANPLGIQTAAMGGVISDQVKCNCGWSWKISDGGNDPYTCHKCGNDNSYKETTNNQNNMKKKMGLGGIAPLFDVGSSMLMDLTGYAISDLAKSLMHPKPEARMVKPNTGMTMAMGGQVPVEVEGGEQFEMPNGQQGQFQGPSHAQGGIDTKLPQGTKVYSDRLKGENGKTMAERKEIRERNVAKLSRLISKNPHDKLLKETLKRQQEVADSEEQGDMALQEQANQQQQMQEQAMMQEQMMGQMMQNPEMMMALGGYVQKLNNGTPPYGISPLSVKQAYSVTDPNKTLNVPYNEQFIGMYDGKPLNQEMFPLDNNIPKVLPIATNTSTPNNLPTQDPNSGTLLQQRLKGLQSPIKTTQEIDEDYTSNYVPKTKSPFSKLTDLANNAPEYKIEDVYEQHVSGMPTNFRTKGTTVEGEQGGNLPTSPLMQGVNPVTDMVQNLLMNGVSGYPLESTPVSGKKGKGGFKEKMANILSGKGGDVGEQKGGKGNGAGGDFTRGDIMGMAGTIFGGVAPMANTFMNRAMTPNELNHYREFGAESMRAFEEGEGLASINRDSSLQDLQLQKNTLAGKNRTTAKGVNTLRGLDIEGSTALNQGINQAYAQYANQMLGLKGQKAQQANVIDSTRMAGEEKKAENTLKNLDNFHTQLGIDLTTQSEALQNQGKNLNQEHYNQQILGLLPMLSRYGIGLREDGKGGFERYDVNPVTEEKSAVKPTTNTTTSKKKTPKKDRTSTLFSQYLNSK